MTKNYSGLVGLHPVVLKAIKELGMKAVPDSTITSGEGKNVHVEREYELINGTKDVSVWVATQLSDGKTTVQIELWENSKTGLVKSDYIVAKSDKQIDALVTKIQGYVAELS